MSSFHVIKISSLLELEAKYTRAPVLQPRREERTMEAPPPRPQPPRSPSSPSSHWEIYRRIGASWRPHLPSLCLGINWECRINVDPTLQAWELKSTGFLCKLISSDTCYSNRKQTKAPINPSPFSHGDCDVDSGLFSGIKITCGSWKRNVL